MCANNICPTVVDLTDVCTYTYEKNGEREGAKITHIDDDDSIDGKQGCGLFSSYASVSVLHASSMNVNIYILRIKDEEMKK
jgi:hypothetical protein